MLLSINSYETRQGYFCTIRKTRGMKRTVLIIAVIIAFGVAQAKSKIEPVSIQGVVFEKVDGKKQPLTLANVHCEGTTLGTISSQDGSYDMNLKAGKYKVVFSYVGYKPVSKDIVVKKNTKAKDLYVEIELEPQDKLASK